MICAWEALLKILPPQLRQSVNDLGKEEMRELCLRINSPPELVFDRRSQWLEGEVSQTVLDYVINGASRYSPWAAATASKGYLTAPGGHRIGICGEVVCSGGRVEGIRQVSSVCIRVARDFEGIGMPAVSSTLILGAPGWGKTTLLRDVIRQTGRKHKVCTVDERGELFPQGFSRGLRNDVLLGCPKGTGVEMALRCMGPAYIAVDEITAAEDVRGVLEAAHCGVGLLATAHGTSVKDFQQRPVYGPLLEHKVFSTVLLLRKDKHYTVERMM